MSNLQNLNLLDLTIKAEKLSLYHFGNITRL